MVRVAGSDVIIIFDLFHIVFFVCDVHGVRFIVLLPTMFEIRGMV